MCFFPPPNSTTTFIDDSAQQGDSHSEHIALDNTLSSRPTTALDNSLSSRPSTSSGAALQPTNSDSGPVIIEPYFPGGLATSAENPLDFNFTLFLYDSLRLPFGLFPEDDNQEMEFPDLQQCRLYCSRYAQWREQDCIERGLATDHSQQRRAELSKETMFQQAGHPLGVTLRSGNERFDDNLDDVRLDVFGNVMVLNAPHWSDISAQFTHGFPRRLITSSHRGILAGNITVAARISNQAIRSLSEGN